MIISPRHPRPLSVAVTVRGNWSKPKRHSFPKTKMTPVYRSSMDSNWPTLLSQLYLHQHRLFPPLLLHRIFSVFASFVARTVHRCRVRFLQINDESFEWFDWVMPLVHQNHPRHHHRRRMSTSCARVISHRQSISIQRWNTSLPKQHWPIPTRIFQRADSMVRPYLSSALNSLWYPMRTTAVINVHR